MFLKRIESIENGKPCRPPTFMAFKEPRFSIGDRVPKTKVCHRAPKEDWYNTIIKKKKEKNKPKRR